MKELLEKVEELRKEAKHAVWQSKSMTKLFRGNFTREDKFDILEHFLILNSQYVSKEVHWFRKSEMWLFNSENFLWLNNQSDLDVNLFNEINLIKY